MGQKDPRDCTRTAESEKGPIKGSATWVRVDPAHVYFKNAQEWHIGVEHVDGVGIRDGLQ